MGPALAPLSRQFGTLRVYKDPDVPLTRTLPDGTVEQVLFWNRPGKDPWFHPDRWDEFVASIPCMSEEPRVFP